MKKTAKALMSIMLATLILTSSFISVSAQSMTNTTEPLSEVSEEMQNAVPQETQTVNEVQTQVVVNSTYYFNEAGEMITGWVKTADNKTYFFENAKTTKEGEMIVGWKQIQNAWYYFNVDGSLLTNGTTPDGYIVGVDGAML